MTGISDTAARDTFRENGGPAEQLRSRFDPVLVVISPPRCGSTVVSRSLWQHPRIRWYVHEPYDRLYHKGGDRDSVRAAIACALERPGAAGSGRGVLVKEMTFQAGPLLPELINAATLPVVVTLRDPRLAVWSRMRQRRKGGQDPSFPVAETGWADLENGLSHLQEHAIPYVLVEVTELRRRPSAVLPALCERLGLAFVPQMLSWPSAPDLPLGNLGGEQNHWYARVLTSTGFQPPDEEVPPLDAIPDGGGMRDHVADCLRIYRTALGDPHCLPAPAARPPRDVP